MKTKLRANNFSYFISRFEPDIQIESEFVATKIFEIKSDKVFQIDSKIIISDTLSKTKFEYYFIVKDNYYDINSDMTILIGYIVNKLYKPLNESESNVLIQCGWNVQI